MKDLLVVGGGPAGLVTALCARRAGLTVTVLDRRPEPPLDKACGEGLMPDGVAVLAGLGIAAADLGGAPFAGIRYVDAAGSVPTVAEGSFPDHPGFGVRRTRLHGLLAERADAAGVELRWGTRVDGLRRLGEGAGDEDRAGERFAVVAGGDELTARWLVGADGLHSRLRRWAGLEGRPARRRRFGVRRHSAVAPEELPAVVEVWWGDGCEAYLTPVATGGDGEAAELGVAILWQDRKAGFDELLAGFPALQRRLAGRPVLSRDRGAGPLRQRVRGVARGNLALVGDAAGYVDAITGEGLSLAFQQAAALVPALAAEDLARYRRDCRRLARLPDAMTHLLLFVEARPWLRHRVVAALAADPALFSRLLALHVRALPPSAFGWTGAARLAWRLATA
jgi:flavin-dependent dehydrogenase